MNKRGELLLKQIIEIIIAVIAIIIIITAGAILFRTYFGNQEELQAKGTLERLTQKIDSLEEGETKTHLLMAPSGWRIISFDENNNFNGNYQKPGSLFQKNVVCVCRKKCESDLCQAISLPLKQDENPINIEIRLINLWISNQQTHYTISEKPTTSFHEMDEDEEQKTQIDSLRTRDQGTDQIICELASRRYQEDVTVKQLFPNENEFKTTIKALVLQESSGYPNSVGSCGEIGLGQIMPLIAQSYNIEVYGLNPEDQCQYTGTPQKMCDKEYGTCMKQLAQGKEKEELIQISKLFEEKTNIEVIILHYSDYLKQTGSPEMALAAYYKGPGVKDNCQFLNEILVCEGYAIKPTPDEYAARVMARKRIIEDQGMAC